MKLSKTLTVLTLMAVVSYMGGFNSTVYGLPLLGPDLVPNGSFEQTASAPTIFNEYGPTSSYLTDWTINLGNGGAIGVLNDTTNPNLTGGTGTQGAFLSGFYGYYEQDLISSDITTIKPKTTYELTVDMGVPAGYPPPSGSDAPGIILNMIDSSGKVDASTSYYVDNSQNPAFIYYQGSITYADLPQGTMEQFTLSFTTGATPFDLGQALHLEFSEYNGYDDASVGPIVFDNVQVLENAPEPSTYAMMLAGLAVLGFCVRRKGALVK